MGREALARQNRIAMLMGDDLEDFIRRADNFAMKAMDSTDVRMKTVWEVLSDRGRRSVVINDPCSYPPQPIDGWVVSRPWPRAVVPRTSSWTSSPTTR